MAFASHWVVTDHDLKDDRGFDHGPAGSFAAADRHLRGPLVAVGRRRAEARGRGQVLWHPLGDARGATAARTCRSHAPEPLRARQLAAEISFVADPQPVYSSALRYTSMPRRQDRLWPNWQAMGNPW